MKVAKKVKRKSPRLSPKQIQTAVLKRLKKYGKLNFLEQYAMFMGVAQVLEISLKQFAHSKYGIEFEKIERKTLGGIARLLRDKGLRPDFLSLLDDVVERRNYIAHDLLFSQFFLISVGAGNTRFERRILQHAIYEVEQLYFLYEWTEKHKAWGSAVQ